MNELVGEIPCASGKRTNRAQSGNFWGANDRDADALGLRNSSSGVSAQTTSDPPEPRSALGRQKRRTAIATRFASPGERFTFGLPRGIPAFIS